MDQDVLNLVTTSEYNGMRANVINNLKRQTISNDAEGAAGRNPEETLGTGRRSQIRFAPVHIGAARTGTGMRKSGVSARMRGARRLESMMHSNQGRPKLGTSTVSSKHSSSNRKSTTSPLQDGLNKAYMSRYRKAPSKLRNRSKVNADMGKIGRQKGLKDRSRKNFKNESKRLARQKLDYVPF